MGDLSRNFHHAAALARAMTRYRFVTAHRIGKWYPDLLTAQRHACAIGAGFYDARKQRFYAYAGTRLEMSEQGQPAMAA